MECALCHVTAEIILTRHSHRNGSKMSVERVCSNPSCTKTGLHLCSACSEEIYCSKECQKAHWPAHKADCRVAARSKQVMPITQSLESLSVKQLKNVLLQKISSFDKEKKDKIVQQLEYYVEKKELVRFVSKYVKIDEVEKLLEAPTNNNNTGSGSDGTTTSSSKPKKQKAVPTPTPSQLKEQAKLMRQNPGLVRRANAALANMTDQQIREYADHLEQAAKDPNLMKEIEKMSQLDPKEREQLQAIQEGLSGARAMDSDWADNAIQILKTNSGLFKTMLHGRGEMIGGVSDASIDSFIDMAASLDAKILKFFFNTLKFLGGLTKPAMEYYQIADKYTLGLIKYVLIAIAGSIVYFLFASLISLLRWLFVLVYVWIYGSSTASSTAASASSTAVASPLLGLAKRAVSGLTAALSAVGLSGVLSGILGSPGVSNSNSNDNNNNDNSNAKESEGSEPAAPRSASKSDDYDF